MILDIILLVILGVSIFEGLRRGLTRQLLELGGLIAAFILASRHGVRVGQMMSNVINLENYAATIDNPLLNVDALAGILYNTIGYILVFLGVLVASKFLAIALSSVMRLPVVGTVDKFGGMAAGLLKGVLITLVAVWILNLMPVPSITNAIDSSKVAQAFLGFAPTIYDRLREMIGAGWL